MGNKIIKNKGTNDYYYAQISPGFDCEEIRQNYQTISSNIDPKGYILNKLFEQEIITIHQKIEVQECSDAKTRAEKLLKILFKASHPKAFEVFREALQKDYGWIAQLIDGTGSKIIS